METLLSQIYINYILSDSNISLVEVWDKKLFIWRYKGKPTFLSSLGLEFQYPIYYRVDEYKQLSKKYHPDLSSSKSSRVLSGVIQTSINDIREVLEIQNRGYDARNYIQWYAEFDRIISCKVASTRNNLTGELSTRLHDHSKFLQDKFCYKDGSITSLIQEVSEGAAWGKSISDVFKERGETIREKLKRDEVRRLNEKYTEVVPIAIKVPREKYSRKPKYIFVYFTECVETPKGDLTFYGRGRSSNGTDRASDVDQSLLSVFVGGESNNGPLKERKHWEGYANSPGEFIKKYTQRYRLHVQPDFDELF